MYSLHIIYVSAKSCICYKWCKLWGSFSSSSLFQCLIEFLYGTHHQKSTTNLSQNCKDIYTLLSFYKSFPLHSFWHFNACSLSSWAIDQFIFPFMIGGQRLNTMYSNVSMCVSLNTTSSALDEILLTAECCHIRRVCTYIYIYGVFAKFEFIKSS